MKRLNIILHFFNEILLIFNFFFFWSILFLFCILRSKINLNIISLSHTSSQVPSLAGVWSGDYVPSRQGHTSDIHSYSYRRFKSGAPTQQQTSLTSPAGPFYTISFIFFVWMCLVIIDPVQQEDVQLSHHICILELLCCVLVGCIVFVYCLTLLWCTYWFDCLPPTMKGPTLSILGWEHQLVLPVDLHIWIEEWWWRLRDNARKIGNSGNPWYICNWMSFMLSFMMTLCSFEPPSHALVVNSWRG